MSRSTSDTRRTTTSVSGQATRQSSRLFPIAGIVVSASCRAVTGQAIGKSDIAGDREEQLVLKRSLHEAGVAVAAVVRESLPFLAALLALLASIVAFPSLSIGLVELWR